MKILIVGMGNIGMLHGWALTEGGVDVTHVVRKGSLAKHSGDIKLDVLDNRGASTEYYQSLYKPKVVDEVSASDSYDLVMVATNHMQATDAVRQYCSILKETPFLLFAGNWNGPAEIDALLPRSRYLWGYSVFSGACGREGVLYANIQKTYRIGLLEGSSQSLLDDIKKTFAAARITPSVKDNIIGWLWIHFALVGGLQSVVLTQGGLPSEQSPPKVWVQIIRATKDALRVVEKRGVDFRGDPDAKLFTIENDEEAASIFRNGLTSAKHYERTRAHSHTEANPAEMKDIYRNILETGEKLGVDMPCFASFREKILGK